MVSAGHGSGARAAGVPVRARTWRDMRVGAEDLSAVLFEDCTFEGVSFEGARLVATVFVRCRFDRCTFDAAGIEDTRWVEPRGGSIELLGRGARALRPVFVAPCLDRLVVAAQTERLVIADGRCADLVFEDEGVLQHAPSLSGCRIAALDARGARWTHACAIGAELGTWATGDAIFDRCAFIEAKARNVDLAGARFERCSFDGSTFDGARVRFAPGSIFSRCVLSGVDAAGAQLAGVLIEGADACGAKLGGACLERSVIVRSAFTDSDFSDVRAKRAAWTQSTFTGCSFSGLHAEESSLRRSAFDACDFRGARLDSADLHGVRGSMDHATLTGARLSVAWRDERERSFEQGGGAHG